MKIKKIIAAAAALTIAGSMLTGCSTSNDSTETTPTVSDATEITTNEEIIEDEVIEEETSLEDDDSLEDDAVEANPLQPLVDSALTAGEWPMLMEVTDETMISDYFTIDVNDENYSESIFMQCPISANISELIILKATDVDAAVDALTARRDKAINSDAFYPADAERAGASIVGSEGDYAFFIMTDGSADVETVLVEAIGQL